MRKIILFCLILTGFGVKAQSNIYHPFPLIDGTTWKVSYQDHDCVIPPNYGDAKYYYRLLHDTIINTVTYKILEQGPNISSIGGCYGPTGDSKQKIGLLRQDTAARKVFIAGLDGTGENILFDYTLQVGDTIPDYFNQSPFDYNLTVTAIDSALVGNEYRKAIHFEYGNSFIEGVGSTAGFLENLWYFEAASRLICFSINNTNYYGDINSCSLDLSAITETPILPQINIYPNPATDEFTVLLNNPAQKLSVTLHTIAGQLVANYTSKVKQITIPRNGLPAGMYLVRINADNKQSYQKIVLE